MAASEVSYTSNTQIQIFKANSQVITIIHLCEIAKDCERLSKWRRNKYTGHVIIKFL